MTDDANKFMTAISRSANRPYGIRPRTAHIPQMLPNLGSTRPELHTQSSNTMGFDAGSRATGQTFLPTGTPPQRYGKYFGIKPPGSSNY